MSLTTILLTVSVACNVWFVFLLMYDRIMETKLFRFFGKLAGIWKSLHAEEKDSSPEADASAIATAPEIIGKSRFRMTVTRTMTTVPKPQAATSDKGEEVQSDDVTFADEAERKTARVPEEKFDEVFSNIPPEEVEYGEGEPEEEDVRLPAAALTRLKRPSRPPEIRMRHGRNVNRLQRYLSKWRVRSCMTCLWKVPPK